VRAELRSVRASNERLEKRLSRLEDERAVAQARAAAPAGRPEDPAREGDEVPALTVVKLKPRAQSAVPQVPVSAEVREPSETHLRSMLRRDAPPSQPEDEGDEDGDEEAGSGPANPGAAASQVEGTAAYERGLSALKTGNVSGGILMLQDFAEQHPRHPLSDNALYFSGVGLASLNDLEGASALFERVLRDYPAGDARMDAMLRLAECQARLDRKDDARSLYQKLIQTWPGTAAASQAQQRLAQLTQ
jgi:tol-pal system protein YbgF